MKYKKDRIIKHLRKWQIWRTRSKSSHIHKTLVLIGLCHDDKCDNTCLPEDIKLYD